MTAASRYALPDDALGIGARLDAVDECALSLARGLTQSQALWTSPGTGDSVAAVLAAYRYWLRRTVPVLRASVFEVRGSWRARLGDVRSPWWWRLVPPLVQILPLPAAGERDGRVECDRCPVRDLMAAILALHRDARRLAHESGIRDLRSARVRLPLLPLLPLAPRIPLDVALGIVPATAMRYLRRAERVRLHAAFPR